MNQDELKAFCIQKSTTIGEATRAMDEVGYGILFITDKNNKLLGIFTDGDVRKAVLKGINLKDSVSTIMNQDFLHGKAEQKQAAHLRYIKKMKRRQLPILDQKNRLVDVLLLDKLDYFESDTSAILMAGGMGKRLNPMTHKIPKALCRVGDKPILETIIENFLEQGFSNFIFCVNYKGEMIQDYFGDGSDWDAEINYVMENESLGTAGALGLLPERPKKPFFVMNADVLTQLNFRNLMDFHQETKSMATMAVKEYDMVLPYGVIEHDEHAITSITEKPSKTFYANGGIYVLNPECLDYIEKNEAMDMTNLYEKLVQDKKPTSAFPIREYWTDIGQMQDLKKANLEFNDVWRNNA